MSNTSNFKVFQTRVLRQSNFKGADSKKIYPRDLKGSRLLRLKSNHVICYVDKVQHEMYISLVAEQPFGGEVK